MIAVGTRVVVFDLGNVLIPWDRRRLFQRLIDDPDELERFLDEVYTLEENAVLDRGVPLPVVAADLARRHPEHAQLFEAFRDRWIETLGPVVDDAVDLLAEVVRAGHRCFALSNWGRDTFALIRHRYPFLDWFEGMVISGQEGVVKPEPAIFELLCGRYAFHPAEAVFIDDSPANVAVAAELGFDTVLFVDAASLRIELVRRELVG